MTSERRPSAPDDRAPTFDLTQFPRVFAATDLPCPPWCTRPDGHRLHVDVDQATPDDPEALEVPPHGHVLDFADATHWRPLAMHRLHGARFHASVGTVHLRESEHSLTPQGPTWHADDPRLSLDLPEETAADEMSAQDARSLAHALSAAADALDRDRSRPAAPLVPNGSAESGRDDEGADS